MVIGNKNKTIYLKILFLFLVLSGNCFSKSIQDVDTTQNYSLDFENKDQLVGWSSSNWEKGKVEIGLSDTFASQGTQSLLMERNEFGGYSSWNSTKLDIALQKGQFLNASVWCLNYNQSAQFTIRLQPGNKKRVRTIQGIAEWGKKMKIKWVSDADYSSLSISFFVAGKGRTYFDDLKLTVSDTGSTELFEEIPYKPERTLEPISDYLEEEQLIYFNTIPCEKIYPTYIPDKKEIINAGVSISASLGEYEPLSIGIYSDRYSGSLRLETSELINQNGQIIDAKNVSVCVAKMMSLRTELGGYDYTVGPKILEPKTTTKIQIGESVQYWLNFYVPNELSSGVYSGTIKISRDDKKIKAIPLTVHVHDFKLVEPKIERYMFIGWIMRDYSEDELRLAFRDMKQHGMTTVMAKIIPEVSFGKDGRLLLDFSWAKRGVRVFKEVFGNDIVVAGGMANIAELINHEIVQAGQWFSKEIQEQTPLRWTLYEYAYEQIVDKLVDWSTTPYMFIYDEPAGSKYRDLAIAGYKHAKDVKPEVPIAVTTTLEFAETMNDYFNINMFSYYADDFDPAIARTLCRDSKDLYWAYGQSWSNLPHSCATLRYEAGFYAWKQGFEGIGWWAYRVSVKDPQNDLDGSTQDFMMSYQSEQGVQSTLNWEAIREGIDDLKYLNTLEYWISCAKSNNLLDVDVQEATNLLSTIRAAVTVTRPYVISPNTLKGILTSEQMQDYRNQISFSIVKLKNGVSKK